MLKKYLSFIVTICLSLCVLVACQQQVHNATEQSSSDTTEEKLVAATFGNYQISEDDVTNYIEQYRIYIDRTSDEDWATFLDESNLSVEDVRENAIQQLATFQLIEDIANQNDIQVSDEEIKSYIDEIRLENDYISDNEWQAILDTSGYIDNDYSRDVKISLLYKKINEKIVPPAEISEQELILYANTNMYDYIGKEIIDVVFEQEESEAGSEFYNNNIGCTKEDFLNNASVYNDDNLVTINKLHWINSNSDSEILLNLQDTKPGNTCMFTTSDKKIHVIYVNSEFQENIGGQMSIKDMPEQLLSTLKNSAQLYYNDIEADKYIDNQFDKTSLEINNMPSGLSYDVDMDLSTYGTAKTQQELNEEAENLVKEHLEQAELQTQSSEE